MTNEMIKKEQEILELLKGLSIKFDKPLINVFIDNFYSDEEIMSKIIVENSSPKEILSINGGMMDHILTYRKEEMKNIFNDLSDKDKIKLLSKGDRGYYYIEDKFPRQINKHCIRKFPSSTNFAFEFRYTLSPSVFIYSLSEREYHEKIREFFDTCCPFYIRELNIKMALRYLNCYGPTKEEFETVLYFIKRKISYYNEKKISPATLINLLETLPKFNRIDQEVCTRMTKEIEDTMKEVLPEKVYMNIKL